jgi:hypothetical protein
MSRDLHQVRLTGLSADEARSLAATLAAAAIKVESDPGQGMVRVPRSRNRMFRVDSTNAEECVGSDARQAAGLASVTP